MPGTHASRRISLATVAAAAGVSAATVSRIANGQVHRANPQTVARVRKLMDEMGYRPNVIGQALRRRQSRTVALLAANLNNPVMAAIASTTEAALRAAGYVMIMGDTHDEPALQDEYLEAMHAQFVQGYVLVSAVASEGLSRFLARREPVVLVGRRPAHLTAPAPFVGIDNHAAGALAARHFLTSGITRPAVIHTALKSLAIADRLAGFLSVLQEHGISRHDIQTAQSSHLQHLAAGYEAARLLIEKRNSWPAGLFCTSDMMAYGAYRLASEHAKRIPQECMMVGIDDSPLNAWIAPWLTSVHVPYSDFGAAILGQLDAVWRGEQPRDHLLPHTLVIRSGHQP